MITNRILGTLAIAASVLIASCKGSDPAPASANPTVIPVQTTPALTIQLAGASTLAVLAGSSVTNTGATNITGDLGLSPGTSIGGFPPGILTGTQHINDAMA